MTKKLVIIGGFSTIAILCLAMTLQSPPSETLEDDSQKDRLYTTTRGNFKIKVFCQGTLEAIKKYDIPFKGKHISNAEIRSITKNQTTVKKGDIIVEFNDEIVVKNIKTYKEDIADLETKFKQDMDDTKIAFDKNIKTLEEDRVYETDVYLNRVELREKEFYTKKAELTRKVIDLQADFKQSLRQGIITKKTELSKIDNAQNALIKAQQNLKKFNNLDAKQKKNEHLTKIENSETKVHDVKKLYENAKQKLNEGQNKSPDEKKPLEANVINTQKQIEIAQKALDFERASMRNYMQYGHAETKRNLYNELEQKKLAFENVLFSTDAAIKSTARKKRDDTRNIKQNQLYYDVLLKERVIKSQKDERDYKIELIRINDKRDRYQKDYKRTTDRFIRSFKEQNKRLQDELERNEYNLTQMVLKAPVDGILSIRSYRRDGGQAEYRIGSKINPGMVVADIPDLSQFKVNATIPEVYRSMIKTGLTADMYSPAIPTLIISGNLNFIAATVTYKNRWDKNSPKIYETSFATKNSDKRLMPGTSINIEVNVDEVINQVFVPIEALYYKDQDTYCKVFANGEFIETKVKTGRRSNSFVEVLDGLKEGEQVFLLSGVAG
jgi:HlyD family secretion protein